MYAVEQTPLASRACAADSSFLAEATGTPRPVPEDDDDEPSIEEALWRIFTFYADARRPDRLPSRQFLAFCRDCQLLRGKADRAAAEVLVRTRLKGRQNHLTFVDFAEILAAFSQTLRPGEDAFRDVLLEHVLPLAKRRTVGPVDMTGEVETILRRFKRPLDGAFARLGKADLTAFLAFCRIKRLHEATGPGAASPLSIRAAGECYLAATRPGYRRMTRPMFDEALVRLADAAYPSNIALPDKLRALLVQLWRSDGAPRPGSPRKGDDLARAVVDMWRGDDYRDYLAVGQPVADGVPALEQLSPARSPGVR